MVNKITKDDLWSLVDYVDYHNVRDTTTTLAIVTLKSGFILIGKSACLNKDDFDREAGEKIALDNAIDQLWGLEGYRRYQEAKS